MVTLRQLEIADAPALLAVLSCARVTRFIATPPPRLDGFQRFIERMRGEQARGAYACFAVVPHGQTEAIGLFQVHELEPGFKTGEWGFAIAAPHWGTGLFVDAATLVASFAFDVLRVDRLEARAVISNGRGNGALRKLGAVQEAVLRGAFQQNGESHDLALWSILAAEWRHARDAWHAAVRVH
jgi:RimJ/RimL family protein N-acetyltransferase